jgi:hypothetical protein
MSHAILRGANGRRHEVDFGDAEVTIEVYAGETTIEIFIEALNDLSHRKRFALLNLPRDQFSAALGHCPEKECEQDKVSDVDSRFEPDNDIGESVTQKTRCPPEIGAPTRCAVGIT